MSFGDPDFAVRRDEYIIRLIERVGVARSSRLIAARLAQSHEQFSIGAELEDLMADDFCRGRCRWSCRRGRSAARRSWQVVLSVGNPDVAVTVHVNTMRKNDHARTETLHQLSGLVEFQNGVEV